MTEAGMVYYGVPSATSAGSLREWYDAGYSCVVLGEVPPPSWVNLFINVKNDKYLGYPWAINEIMKVVFERADIMVVGSDDVYPSCSADEMRRRYLSVFPDLDGIYEPSGGKSTSERQLAIYPAVGRNFYKNYNCGNGIYDTSYRHFYADQELAIVSTKLGKMHQDDTLKYDHRHWSRTGQNRPAHMARWKATASDDGDNFNRRRASDFNMVKWL